MFTGIIEEMGVVQAVDRRMKSARLSVLAKVVLSDLGVGDSLSVNGVCLTVCERTDSEFKADVSPETLSVTNLDALKTGDAVNLERAVRVNARLGGHLVAGHIDGVGIIRDRQKTDDAIRLWVEIPKDMIRYCVLKGSIAMDGVSLTINEMGEKEIRVMIIPQTARATTLGLKAAGTALNIECDLIGKYLERLLMERSGQMQPPKVDQEYLKRRGLI